MDEPSAPRTRRRAGHLAVTAPASQVNEWADGDFNTGSEQEWDVMLADMTAAYSVSRDSPEMRAHVKRQVLEGIRAETQRGGPSDAVGSGQDRAGRR